MPNLQKYRQISASAFESIEQRMLFSGYATTAIASLPALSTTFINSEASALVRDSAGNLYGVDPQGGAATYGTVFEVSPSTKTLTVLYTFDGVTGVSPMALAIDSSGNLFGIDQATAATGSGSTELETGASNLFEITAANRSTATVLYAFSNTSIGISPTALLVDPSTNNVDVLADGDGANDGGAILQFKPASNYGTPTVLGSLTTTHFVYSDSLALGSDGTLYGTSVDGGGTGAGDGAGTLFSLSPGSSTVNTLATFDAASTGNDPEGSPYIDSSGNVYGTVSGGTGAANLYGGVWEYTKASGTLTEFAELSDSVASVGIDPLGGVVPDGSGNFLGTTSQGADNGGSIFSASPTAHTITDVAQLDGTTTGSMPEQGLTPDGSGNFFGITSSSGLNSNGAVFEVSPSSGGGTGGGGGGTTGSTGTGTVTPTIAKSTVAATLNSGQKTKTGVVSVTVTNTGTSIDGSTTQLYASTDGLIDASSVAVGKPTKKLTLKAGKSGKASFALPNLTLPVGSYTILAETTDLSGAVSIATGPSVTVVAPVITLSAVVGAVSPASVVAGKSIGLTVTITNSGNINSTGPATIDIGLSIDGVTLSVPLKPQKTSRIIKPDGAAVAIKFHVAIPKTQSAGTFFPVVTFTQGANTFTAVGTASFTVT